MLDEAHLAEHKAFIQGTVLSTPTALGVYQLIWCHGDMQVCYAVQTNQLLDRMKRKQRGNKVLRLSAC